MSLLDHVRRIVVDEAKGTVTDPRPFYAAAGLVDTALGFARSVPARLEKVADQAQEEWTADRFGEAFGDLVDKANVEDLRARGQQLRERVADTVKDRRDAVVDELADLSADARDLPNQVALRARQAPGRAAVGIANQVGAAYELYDTFVDRGRIAVARLRGDATPGSTPSPANRITDAPSDIVTPVTRPRPPVVTPPPPVPAVPSPSSLPSTAPRPRPRKTAVAGSPPAATVTGAPESAAKRAARARKAAALAGAAGPVRPPVVTPTTPTPIPLPRKRSPRKTTPPPGGQAG